MLNDNFQNMDTLSLSRLRQAFMTKVYGWMFVGLMFTGITSWYTFDSGLWIQIASNSILFFGLIIAEFALVWFIAARVATLSVFASGSMFLVYSILNGLTLSVILARYTLESISEIFFLTAAMFLALSIFGFVTKKDLTGVGNFMLMGLFGIIGISIINIFFHSSMMSFIVSVAGVIIFSGLTAYDTQKLKEMAIIETHGGEAAQKTAISGALALYLDFINLFIFLLSLLGNRR